MALVRLWALLLRFCFSHLLVKVFYQEIYHTCVLSWFLCICPKCFWCWLAELGIVKLAQFVLCKVEELLGSSVWCGEFQKFFVLCLSLSRPFVIALSRFWMLVSSAANSSSWHFFLFVIAEIKLQNSFLWSVTISTFDQIREAKRTNPSYHPFWQQINPCQWLHPSSWDFCKHVFSH